jgi:TPP-dependent pyruvate/acetoin dehydrogenase alpha subunit
MFKVKENDIFEKNMSQQELYQVWKKMKAKREMDKFLNKLIKKNGVTKI